MWRDVVSLCSISHSANEYGDMVQISDNQVVFANKKSVRQSEFYQAHATGFKPELMFEVRFVDYEGQSQLIHDGKTYNIIRTFSKSDEIVELVCSGLVLTGGV
jgi:SPP1 family predicted phage head-tail adaptor